MRNVCAIAIAALAVSVAAPGCGGRPSGTALTEVQLAAKNSHEAFRAGRIESLKQDDGWLALAGLTWLVDGTMRLGTDHDAAIVLPPSSPPFLGTLVVNGSQAVLQMAPGVQATLAGAPFVEGPLRSDADPAVPQDRVRVGAITLSIIDRGGKLGLRVHDANAATRLEFQGIETFPWSPRWIVEGRLHKFPAPKKVPVPTAVGIDDSATVPGVVVFEIDGVEHRLEPFQEEGDTGLFFVFADASNGKETYGGGRFLVADLPKAGTDTVVLDFNRAFTPPCAFTPYATCPVPRPENRLRIYIAAGEKTAPHKTAH